MADTKITALAAITTVDPAADVLPIVDISDTSMAASGTTKKITSNQILGAGGTATLASATITGDLTVDTSTLKVDSANNRVIVGHTSGSSAFQVTNAGAAGLEIQPTGFSSAPLIVSYNRSGSAYTQLTLDGSTIVHALSGSTAMTLNSTGLGVGQSPTAPLHIFSSATGTGPITNVVGTFRVGAAGRDVSLQFSDTANQAYVTMLSGALLFATGGATERMRIDTTGNVGIGVTPSAWASAWRANEVQRAGNALISNAVNSMGLTSNAYLDSVGWKYGATGTANFLAVGNGNGSLAFYTAASGTGGTAITDFASPKMQVDANGNLILSSSATPPTLTTNGQLTVNATSNTNLRFSYRGSDGTTRVANITLA